MISSQRAETPGLCAKGRRGAASQAVNIWGWAESGKCKDHPFFFWKIKHEPQKICHVFSSGTYIQSRCVQWWTEKMYTLYESRGLTALSEHEWWHGSWRRTELLWCSEAWMFKMRTKKEEGRKEQTKTCYWCSSNQNAWQLSSSWYNQIKGNLHKMA